MANQQQNFLTAIDVGSAKTCALVAEVTDTGLRYRGHGVAESRGSRKGVICRTRKSRGLHSESGGAGGRRRRSADRARPRWASAGAHVRGVNSHGGISLGHAAARNWARRNRAAVDKARAIPLPADREILHLLPQEFILDDQSRRARSAGHDGHAPRSPGAHGHRRLQRHAERSHRREPRRSPRRRHRLRAAGRAPIPCCAPTSANWASAWPTWARARPS